MGAALRAASFMDECVAVAVAEAVAEAVTEAVAEADQSIHDQSIHDQSVNQSTNPSKLTRCLAFFELVWTCLDFFSDFFRTWFRNVLKLFLDKQKPLPDPCRTLWDTFFGHSRKLSTEPSR